MGITYIVTMSESQAFMLFRPQDVQDQDRLLDGHPFVEREVRVDVDSCDR